MSTTASVDAPLSTAHTTLQNLRQQLSSVIIGQQAVIDATLIALLAGGHILIEGVPGLGKTLLVRALAKSFAGQFSRIQFTPDLMPSDVTGHSLYDMQAQSFKVRKGPVFTNLLLADEINRAPAKTQAALLEVMQEQQVTIDARAFPVGSPYMVLATQNPIEQEGTYPLPEAELDRFMLKVLIDYPSYDDEMQLLLNLSAAEKASKGYLESIQAVCSADDILTMRHWVDQIEVDTAVMDYALRLVRATRDWAGVIKGAGPRGSIYLLRAAKAHALLQQKSFVTPDDIKQVALPVLRHRVLLSADREIEGVTTDQLLQDILAQVEAPRR